MGNTQLNNIIKHLEKKGLTKTVKGLQQNRKKVFMLISTVPNAIITGGAIGTIEQEGIELINELMQRVFDFVCRQSNVTIGDL